MITRVMENRHPTAVERLPASAKLGALGLAFPLVAGRWGSYIGIEPVFFADALLIAGSFWTFLLSARYPVSARFPAWYWVLWTTTGLFIVLSILLGEGDLVVRLRDLLPWFYLLLLPAVVQWCMAAGPSRIINFLTITLLAHAAWAIPAMLGVLPLVELPVAVFGQPLFSVRPDIDVPLLAGAVVIVLYRWGPRPLCLLFSLLAAGAATAQTSRAALVGSAMAIVVFAHVRGHLRGFQGIFRMLATATVAAVAILVLLPSLTARTGDEFGTGALARAGLYGSSSAEASGEGTAGARFQAWGVLLSHYSEAGYPALGAGAGAEVVRDTGAVRYLSGDPDVRAPHNWWIHAIVRTGYVGILLWIALLGAGMRLRANRTNAADAGVLKATGALLIVSVLLTGTLGVVVEAPFGSQVLLLGVALFGLPAQRRCRFTAAAAQRETSATTADVEGAGESRP